MRGAPKISIITICYNDPELVRTCESIMDQTCQDFEWVVIDGGSDAETLAVFDKYKDRIDVFISEPDNGIYDALNKGVRNASGEFINFMNAGDKFADNDVLRKMNDALHPSDEILYGYVYYANNGMPTKRVRVPLESITKNKYYWIRGGLPHQSMFFKNGLLEKHGFYRLDYPVYADWAMNIKLWNAGVRFRFADICVSHFDHTGISSNPWSDKSVRDRINIINEFYPEFAKRLDFRHPKFFAKFYTVLRFFVLPWKSKRRKLQRLRKTMHFLSFVQDLKGEDYAKSFHNNNKL